MLNKRKTYVRPEVPKTHSIYLTLYLMLYTIVRPEFHTTLIS